MTEWRLKAACRNHPNPEWWFPKKRSDPALKAKAVCVRCPVRINCGKEAIGIGERHAVMGGYRCSSSAERAQLRLLVGLDSLRTVACEECGTEFETRQRRKRCPDCCGLTAIEPVKEHVRALKAASVTNVDISARSGVPVGTVAKLVTGHPDYDQRHCSKEIAEKILAVPIPGEAA